MLFLASSLSNLPVITQRRENLGFVKEAVFDPKVLKLVGVLIQRSILQSQAVIAPLDILKISSGFLLVKNRDVLLPATEIVRVNKLLRDKKRLIGMRAETLEGRSLGRVYDLLFDEVDGRIVKFYLRSLVNEKILPVESLFQVEEKRLIFNIEEIGKEKANLPLPAVE